MSEESNVWLNVHRAFMKAENLAEVLDVLLDHVVTLVGDAKVAVLWVEPASKTWHLAAGVGFDLAQVDAFNRRRQPADEAFLAKLRTSDWFEAADAPWALTLLAPLGVEGSPVTLVPLVNEREVAGLLLIRACSGDTRLHDARFHLPILAHIAVSAMERVQLAEAHQWHRTLVELVEALDKKVSSFAQLDALLSYISARTCHAFQYDRVGLYLREGTGLTVYQAEQPHYAITPSTIPLDRLGDEHPVARVLTSEQPVYMEETMAEWAGDAGRFRTRAHLEWAVPVIWNEQIIGVLDIESDQMWGVGSETRSGIQALADHIAIAIENSRLLSMRERRLTELATVTNLGYAISSVLDQKRVSQLILDSAASLTDASHAGLFLKKPEGLVMAGSLSKVTDGANAAELLSFEQAMAVTESGQSLLVPATSKNGYSILSVPLRAKNNVIGVIQVARPAERGSCDLDDQRVLEALALPSSVALENARLYQEIERRLAEVSTLYTLAERMTSSLDLHQMLDSLVVILRRVIDCRGCCIFLLDETSGLLEIRAASGLKPKWQREAKLRVGEGISGRVVKEERPIYIPDTRLEPDFIFFDPEVRSLLVVPMITKGHVIGTLSVDDDEPNAFDPEEGRLLTIAAAQAATIIENARLYESLKERARRLKLAYEELKELNRLKSEFVQNVSHELRTPLTFIRGYVELLLDGSLGELNDAQAEALKVVAAKTQTLTRLVSDIISLEKAEKTSLDLAPVSLSDVIELALRGAEIAAQEAGLTIINAVPPDLEPVLADRARLGQVLDNLVGNALKFTPAGGRIEVRVDDAGDFERVSVIDTGIGIPKEKQEKIFEPFYQIDGSTTRRFGGAGLGLAIVKQIVEAHGGEVGVISEPGKGSQFFFTVPKYRE